jgi:hypothetical protein
VKSSVSANATSRRSRRVWGERNFPSSCCLETLVPAFVFGRAMVTDQRAERDIALATGPADRARLAGLGCPAENRTDPRSTYPRAFPPSNTVHVEAAHVGRVRNRTYVSGRARRERLVLLTEPPCLLCTPSPCQAKHLDPGRLRSFAAFSRQGEGATAAA